MKTHSFLVCLWLLTALAPFDAAPAGASTDLQAVELAVRQRNFEKAAALLKRLANEGNAEAQYRLGALYRTGRGVKADHAKAAHWFEKAALQGHKDAQYNIGVMYARGWGVKADRARAREWLEKASGQGHHRATAYLEKLPAGKVDRSPRDDERLLLAGKQVAAADLLRQAALADDLERLRKLLGKKGIKVNARDKYGRTALIEAAANRHPKAVRLLLQHGANPNIADRYGDTPLLAAAGNGDVESIKALLAGGADIHHKDKLGNTPLLAAVARGHTEAARALLAGGARVNITNDKGAGPLELARGKPELQTLLRKAGASPVAVASHPRPSVSAEARLHALRQATQGKGQHAGWSPLMLAAWQGDAELVEHLIKNGARIDEIDAEGHSPLTRAAWNGDVATIQALLRAGATVNDTSESSIS